MADLPVSLVPELVVDATCRKPQCEEKAWGNVHGCSCLMTEGHHDLHTKEPKLGPVQNHPVPTSG